MLGSLLSKQAADTTDIFFSFLMLYESIKKESMILFLFLFFYNYMKNLSFQTSKPKQHSPLYFFHPAHAVSSDFAPFLQSGFPVQCWAPLSWFY